MRRIPVATALARTDRMWPAVIFSVALHAALVAWGLLRAPGVPIDLEQKPIVAKLVRIGEKKPEEYLPRKEAAPPPAPAAPAAVPIPAVAAPAAPVAKPGPKAAPAKPQPAAPARGSGTTLASVLSRVERDVEDRRWGAPDGDPAGDSDTGEEGDRYLALVQRELKSNYDAPATISERERIYLKATVLIYIEPDGRIARWRVQTPSGNAAFDAAVERTLRLTRVPPPPPELRETYRRSGLPILFTADS